MAKNKPTHFAVEDIKFYAMDEDNEIVKNEKGEEVIYRLKEGVRFKPLESLLYVHFLIMCDIKVTIKILDFAIFCYISWVLYL